MFGDGAIIRAGLDALFDVLGKFAAPTGERGSILLMSGGLIVLGFLFLAFLFRSAIVGDLAPVANARAPTPRILPPPRDARAPFAARAIPPRAFDAGRSAGRGAEPSLDAAFAHLREHGADARILQSNASWKRVRVYRCSSCQHGTRECEYERGLLAGAFERVTGELAKVHEATCATRGDAYCEFDVSHAVAAEAS